MHFLLRRTLTLFATLLLVSLMTFAVFQVIPGDPALIILGLEAEEEQIRALQQKLGSDQPLFQRFIRWLGGVLTGDMGESLRFSLPVTELIWSRFPVTLSLSLMSMGLTVVLAIPLGIIAARAQGKWSDYLVSITTQFGMAIPSFWLGILLMLFFGIILSWFSPGGYVPWSEDIWGAFRSLFLPSLAIAIPQIAVVVRYLRTLIIEQLNADYVRTARGKGMKERIIIYKHVLRNALIPVVTVLGMIFADVLAGSLIIEQVFALPGLGRLLISSISYRDFPLIQGMVVYITLIVILIHFVVDLLYRVLDPRISLK
jgi:peptide/nickel transport system permease protein